MICPYCKRTLNCSCGASHTVIPYVAPPPESWEYRLNQLDAKYFQKFAELNKQIKELTKSVGQLKYGTWGK